MKYLITAILLTICTSLFAKDNGYKIEVEFKNPIKDQKVLLARYYAKGPPTIYRMDSATVKNERIAVFQNNDSILGGIYMILFDNNTKYLELFLDNGYDFKVKLDQDNIVLGTKFTGSKVNQINQDFQKEIEPFTQKNKKYTEDLASAKNNADSVAIQAKMKTTAQEFKVLRTAFAVKNKDNLFGKIFGALEDPLPPAGIHYLEDGKTVDSFFDYHYSKKHYWDNFDFQDDRLIIAPFFEKKLSNYFTNYIYPVPDSLNAAGDELLEKMRGTKELFKYTLFWLVNHTINNKIMGLDESYIHFIENYYVKGDAYWVDDELMKKYIDRAQKIAPTVLGSQVYNLKLKDAWTLQDVNLYDVDAAYTVLLFWSPKCHVCKEEIPLIDSLYQKELKSRGVKIVAIPTGGVLEELKDYYKETKLNDWVHLINTGDQEENDKIYQDKFDVYATPRIFLLDKDKRILGKQLDHNSILKVLEFNEKKRLANKY